MKADIIAILFAAAALPAAAQTPAPRPDPRPAAPLVQAKEGTSKPDAPATLRERAKAAKAQQKKNKQLARQKDPSQKKAPAS